MKKKLVLKLTGEHLSLELVRPAHAPSLWAPFLRFGNASAMSATQHQLAHAEVSGPMSPTTLPQALEDAWTALNSGQGGPNAGLAIAAQLGMAHARLGLLQLAEVNTAALSSSTADTLAKAWVRQMWGVDPERQVIRWQGLSDPGKILVSCVDRAVFDTLEAFCRRQGLRFVSCLPALLEGLDLVKEAGKQSYPAGAAADGTTTLVWTEASPAARRSTVVQLLLFEGAELRALWQGWIGAPASIKGPDVALEAAIRRFHAQNKLATRATVIHHCWVASSAQAVAAAALSHA